MMHLLWVLAATPEPGPVDPNKVQPGFLGLGFMVALALAVVAMYFSMRKHLGRIDVGRHHRERRAASETPEPKES
jgi:hypothetical protein